MPIIKSAKKRVRIAHKATARNVRTKKNLRAAMKAFQVAVASGNKTKAAEMQNEVFSAIDTAAKKNVMSASKASRKKSQVSTIAKSAGVKLAPTQPKAAKPAAKKAPAKAKTAVKKPVAKKPAAKKPAASKK